MQTSPTEVGLIDPGHDTFYYAATGASNAGSAEAQLKIDIAKDSQPGNPYYSNVAVQGSYQSVPPSDTTKFDQGSAIQFSAVSAQSSDEGQPVIGLYGELYSTSSHNSVFVTYWSSSQSAFQANEAALKAMDKSITG